MRCHALDDLPGTSGLFRTSAYTEPPQTFNEAPGSMSAAHLDGIEIMLKARGCHKLRDDFERELFTALQATAVSHCTDPLFSI